MSGSQSRSFLVLPALLGGLFAAAPVAADVAQRHARIIERLAPQEQRAYIERLIAQQQARAAAGLVTDSTGPTLTAFNSVTTFNLGKGAAPFKVTTKATDDLSGVRYLYFVADGPSGQSLFVYSYGSYYFPSLNSSGSAGFTSINRMAEPGTWKFKYGYGYDLAGNYSYFDEALLDSLGNTTFTVVNNGGYDLVKPLLTAGKIITPAVSLSAVAPGTTDAPPFVGVKVTATDAGNTALAGVRQVQLYFCKLADPNVCIYPVSYSYATGQAMLTMNAGVQVSAASGNLTGSYELKTAYIYDHAGNYTVLTSTAFGGVTDFSTIFPDGRTIKLKP